MHHGCPGGRDAILLLALVCNLLLNEPKDENFIALHHSVGKTLLPSAEMIHSDDGGIGHLSTCFASLLFLVQEGVKQTGWEEFRELRNTCSPLTGCMGERLHHLGSLSSHLCQGALEKVSLQVLFELQNFVSFA